MIANTSTNGWWRGLKLKHKTLYLTIVHRLCTINCKEGYVICVLHNYGMIIKDLRILTGMSQKQFSNSFGIPLGTLRNWEQGIAKPPKYVFDMIVVGIRRDRMINIETIKFLKILDNLADRTKIGIYSFAEATQNNRDDRVFYDPQNKFEDGSFGVVLESCVIDDQECYHHDVISYYDSESNEYTIHAAFSEDDESGEQSIFLLVELETSGEQIVIENGQWYFV